MISFNVAYIIDDGFTDITAVSIISLLKNNKSCNIILHLVLDNVREENKNKLKTLVENNGGSVFFYECKEQLDKIRSKSIKWRNSTKLTTWIRIFLGSILSKDVSSVLLIDGDTVVGSIGEVFQYINEDHAIWAVEDVRIWNRNKPYYNGGVLLLNLER